MFDPTAYENMKVVLEGAIYDRDLAGEIHIIDRDDLVNLSKLSRQYIISFQTSLHSNVSGRFTMTAELKNFAAELLPIVENNDSAGCQINIQFLVKSTKQMDRFTEIDHLIKSIWGLNREILYELMSNPLNNSGESNYRITLLFNRLVYEEQLEDLDEMIDYMIATANELDLLLHKM